MTPYVQFTQVPPRRHSTIRLGFCPGRPRSFPRSRSPNRSGSSPVSIHAGDRIAQMIVARYEPVEGLDGDLADSARGGVGSGTPGR
jgi:hypothetical protein